MPFSGRELQHTAAGSSLLRPPAPAASSKVKASSTTTRPPQGAAGPRPLPAAWGSKSLCYSSSLPPCSLRGFQIYSFIFFLLRTCLRKLADPVRAGLKNARKYRNLPPPSHDPSSALKIIEARDLDNVLSNLSLLTIPIAPSSLELALCPGYNHLLLLKPDQMT